MDVDRETLAPEIDELERLLTQQRAKVVFVLHTHLLGARAVLEGTVPTALLPDRSTVTWTLVSGSGSKPDLDPVLGP